jgi:hypothetical protein
VQVKRNVRLTPSAQLVNDESDNRNKTLPANIDHPCFISPENKQIKIWRYMDISKYISLLITNSLFFARSDLFDDPYEGATSHVNSTMRSIKYKESIYPKSTAENISKFNDWVRHWTYITCWHMNDVESEAMWKLYTSTNEAIAIQSTFECLHKCLPNSVYLGIVKYINYETDWLPEGNTFLPFVHKRKSFVHEQELRGVTQELPEHTDKYFVFEEINKESGKLISVNLQDLVNNIYISPTAPEWFDEIVYTITRKFGFSFKIIKSILNKKPTY